MTQKPLSVEFDSKATVSFAALSTLIMCIDAAARGHVVPVLFWCPGKGAFDLTFVVNYLRIFLHVLGNASWTGFFVNTFALLLLGPALEERYGTKVLCLMMAVTALLTGILAAFLSPAGTSGAECIVIMMILLETLTAFTQKDVPLSWALVLLLYVAYRFYDAFKSGETFAPEQAGSFVIFWQKNILTLVSLAGGIIGSLFGFLLMPRRSAPASPRTERPSWRTASEPQNQRTPWKTPYDKPNPYDGTTSEPQGQRAPWKTPYDKPNPYDGTASEPQGQRTPWKTPYDKPNPYDGTTSEQQKKKKPWENEEEIIGTIEL